MDMDLKDYPILVIVSKVFYAESLYCFVKPKVGYLTLHRSYMFADIYRIIPKLSKGLPNLANWFVFGMSAVKECYVTSSITAKLNGFHKNDKHNFQNKFFAIILRYVAFQLCSGKLKNYYFQKEVFCVAILKPIGFLYFNLILWKYVL